LIIEPDAAGRAMMDRVVTADGFSADTAVSAVEVRALLDAGVFEVVVVDELAGSRPALEEVRWLRHKYPTLPIIVIGALLSRRVMQELLRLRVADVLAKPFTPDELRESVARAIEQKTAHHEEALEYDVALTDARRAIAAGVGTRARAPLARAQAMSPFDSEIMALQALLAEIEGKDAEADHGYRAALALRDEEACPPPDPHEGLARLGAYGGARPVAALSPERATHPCWIVSDPAAELRRTSAAAGPLDPREPHVVVMGLGLPADGPGMVFLREGPGPRAFALLAGSLRAESVASALATLGAGAIVATQTTAASLDLARVNELRAKGPPSPRGSAASRERSELGGSRDEIAKRDQVAR
jgi:DNA-binding response OmpR family regulator